MEPPEIHTFPIIPSLTWKVWLCYGVGHVLNDICASMWFTYLLVFFHLVLKFDRINAGLLLLVGQIADGLSTSFVGIECDKSIGLCFNKYGRRKSWHIIGTLCILGSFPFIFTPCLGCQNAHVAAQMVYYSAFVIIFQFGWAAVQISHLALIPELTPDNHQRTQLTSVRYSFSVASTILIYILTWISLKSGNDFDKGAEMGLNNAVQFQRVVYIGLLIGLIASSIFHWGINEGSIVCRNKERRQHKTVTEFLRIFKFYQIAVAYMCSRLFVNIGQVYIPLYLHERWSNKAENMALVPLLMYSGSIAASLVLNHLNRTFGRKVTYVLGSVLGALSCVWIRLANGGIYEICTIAVLLGAAGSVLVVTALGLTADLIGFDTDTGAFVYGAMSFSDKLSNGVVVMAIQYLHCASCSNFYQRVLVFVCGGAALLGMLSVLGLKSNMKVHGNGVEEAEETKPLIEPTS